METNVDQVEVASVGDASTPKGAENWYNYASRGLMDTNARGTWEIVRGLGAPNDYVRETIAGATEQEAWDVAFWYFRNSCFWGVPAIHTPMRIV